MKLSEARDILLNEASCVMTASSKDKACNRECDGCELVLPSRDIIRAYIGICDLVNFYIREIGDDDIICPIDLDEYFDEIGIGE